MLHLPTPMLMGAPQGKTYAQWQAEAARLAENGTLPWATNSGKGTGKYRATPGALGAANLWGSSWMTHFTYDSSVARMVQHGVANQAMFDAIQAGGFEVYFEIVDIGVQPIFTSLNRNGFPSSAYTDYQAMRCIDLIVWDGAQAWRMNPFAGTGPAPYDWII